MKEIIFIFKENYILFLSIFMVSALIHFFFYKFLYR